MTTTELIKALEELADTSGDWEVRDDNGNAVTGVRLTPKGVVVEVEG